MAVISPQEQPRVTVQVPVPTPVPPPTYAPAFQQPPQQQVAQQTQVMPNPAYQQAFAPQPQPVPQQPAPQPIAQEPVEQDYFTPKKYSGPVAFIFPHAGQSRPKYRPKKMERFRKAVRRLACAERPVRKELGSPDEEAFHETIHRNLSDHLPHLVYADWLEENGKPSTAQAIRQSAEDHPVNYMTSVEDREGRMFPEYWQARVYHDKDLGGWAIRLAGRSKSRPENAFVWQSHMKPNHLLPLVDSLFDEGVRMNVRPELRDALEHAAKQGGEA